MNKRESIEKTKKCFEESFRSGSFYNKQTRDEKRRSFFFSDPAPNDDDTEHFVDEYMQMKKDGHIKFYTQDEWKEIAGISGLKFLNGFETAIRFPRKKETALEFDDIMKHHDEKVIKGYEVEVVGDEIWITERVNNLFFEKIVPVIEFVEREND